MKLSSIVDLSKALISNDDKEANIKHFIIFMTAIHYFLASFMILFGIVRSTVDKDMMKQILDNDFYIILVGVGVLTLENIGQALSSRANVLSSLFSTKKTEIDNSGAVTTVEEKQQTSTVKVPPVNDSKTADTPPTQPRE
jgi:hypothetical protein